MLEKGQRIAAQDVIEAIGTGGGNGGGLETGDIGIASFPIDESQGRRVYLNGQVIAQGKFEDFTAQLKEAAQKYPNMVCTEEEWQEIAAQDEDGQVGKFVIDDTAGTIRLPRIIKLQGTLNFTEVGDLIESGGAGGGGLEVGDIGISPFIDESRNLRRYLNGQVISQSQFAGFATKLKKAVQTYPNLATTEDDWQAIKSNSKIGQVGKFVIDDTAKTIRLPCIVKLQGLLDLSNIGNIVDDGLPTHTHTRGTMNITGGLGAVAAGSAYATYTKGAFTNPKVVDTANTWGSTDGSRVTYDFDASKSWTGSTSTGNYSSNLATTNTVQEEAVQYPYFIQVANGYVEDVNIDMVASKLNNDFSNAEFPIKGDGVIVQSENEKLIEFRGGSSNLNGAALTLRGKNADYPGVFTLRACDVDGNFQDLNGFPDGTLSWRGQSIAAMGMPGNKTVDLTLGASGTYYTAPANGYVFVKKSSTAANQSIELYTGVNARSISSASNQQIGVFAPVRKGFNFSVTYNLAGDTQHFKFIYAEGDNI